MVFLRTLGGLSLENGNGPGFGAGSQRRPLAILALIAAAGDRGISREKLATLLWPDSENPRAALKQALYSLRRELSAQELTAGSTQLRLNPDLVESDVGRFENELLRGNLESAVEQYKGPFLEGVRFKDLEEFDRYVEHERDRLTNKFRAAVESLATSSSARRDFAGAARYWGTLAREDPCSARIAVEYMKALAAAGEREAALRHAEVHGTAVRQQLETEPDPAVSMLASRLRIRGNGAAAQNAGAAPPVLPHIVDTAPAEAATNSRAKRIWSTRVVALSATAIMVVFLAMMVSVKGLRGSAAERPPAVSQSVVVIPFENKTGSRSLEPLGLMGAEWITDGLSRINLVPVIDPRTAAEAMTSLRQTRGKRGYSLADIGRTTGAENVITGSFFQRGDSLEFYGRIINTRTGNVLGAIEPVTVPFSDASKGIGMLRSRMLSLLAQKFDARIAQVTVRDAMPPNIEAYSEFVAGVDRWVKDVVIAESDTGVANISARQLFRNAYSKDTTFVTALVWALFTYDLNEPEGRSLLDSLKARKRRLTPLDSYAVDYFAANASGNTAAALKAAAAASDIAPQSEWSWNAGFMLMPMNRPRETLKYFSRLDPDRGWMRNGWEYYWYLRAQIMHMLGDFKGTHAWLTRARRKFPESVPIAAAYARSLALNGQPDSLVVITKQILQSTIGWRAFYAYSIIEDLRRHGHLREQRIVFDVMSTWYEGLGRNATEDDRRNFGSALLSMGLDSLAEQHYKALYAASRKSGWRTSYTGQLARLAAKRGDTAAASRIIELVPEADEQWSGEKNYWRAQVAAELGQREEAVRLLRTAFDKGYPQMSLSHSDWYDFPKLQGYPPFEALVNSTR